MDRLTGKLRQAGKRLSTTACFAGAALLLCSAAAQQPPDPVTTAARLIRDGHFDEAIAEAQRGLRTHAEDQRLLTIEGIAYSMKGDDAAAVRALDAALRRDPKLLAALRAKAQIDARRHLPETIDVLNRILALAPSDDTAREMLAVEQARKGQCDQALSNFALVEQSIDTHTESLLRDGACLFDRGKNTQAVEVFEKLLAAHPDSRDLRFDLAMAQFHAGDSKSALTTLAPLTGDDADVDTLSLAAEAAEASGDTAQSVALLRRAIVLNPGVPDQYVRFAEVCLQHESYAAGIDMVSAGLKKLPRSAALYLTRGMLYGGKGDYVNAEADFRTAEELDPAHGVGAYGLGLVQAQDHHPEEAIATARKGLNGHPDDGQLQLLLARLQLEAGERPGSPGFAEAFHAAQASVRLRPDLVATHDVLSKAYMLQGDMPHVIDECRASLRLDPEDATAMYRLLLASKNVGDTETVKRISQQIAELHQKSRTEETERLRYRIETAPARP